MSRFAERRRGAIYSQSRKKRKKKRPDRLIHRQLARRGSRLQGGFGHTGTALTQSRYRRAADSYALDANGALQICNGIDIPLRFDPSLGVTEEAGVKAPAGRILVSGAGTGKIVGTFHVYSRFVDRDGYFSSLSQVSDPFEAESSAVPVTAATNASPIVITASSGVGTGDIVKISGVGGNTAANGTWFARGLTATTFELYSDELLAVPAIGNGTYSSGGQVKRGLAKLVYSSVPLPTEDRVVRRQILRNKDGNTAVFYVDIDTEDLTSTAFESSTDSNNLLNGVSLVDESGLTLVDKTRPPNYKKFNSHHLGRMFFAGNEPYSEGAASVVQGSKFVTGIATEWGPLTFTGRRFETIGGGKQYTIAACHSTTLIELTEAYEAATDPYARYLIHPGDGERRTFYWSEPAEPEAVPLENTLTLEEDVGAGEITGLMPLRSWLYVLCESRIYRFSFVNEPLLDGFVVKASKRGCVNNRSWQLVEDLAYLLDYTGFHAFAGNDDQDIGTPAVQDLFRNRPHSRYRINWAARRTFHSIYDPGESTIRWFVCLNGADFPQHAICYHIRLQRWWIEEYPFPIGSSVLGRLNGKPQVFLGTTGRRIVALGQSVLDVVNPDTVTCRGTATSSGVDWIADSAASFSAGNALAGTPVCIVRGKGKGQRRVITSNSSTRLNVSDPWLDRPDSTSVYQVGGIQARWRTGFMQWAPAEYQSTRAVTLQFRPTEDDAELYVKVYRDLSEDASEWSNPQTMSQTNGIARLRDDAASDLTVDTTKANGYVTHRFDGGKDWYTDGPRFVQYEVNAIPNEELMLLYRLIADGAGGRK